MPLHDVVRKYDLSSLSYADDTQLYITLGSSVPSTHDITIAQLESRVAEIRSWMLANMLKLNDDKTEFMQFLPSTAPNISTDPDPVIQIGTAGVSTCPQAQNLGIIFDSELSSKTHITVHM